MIVEDDQDIRTIITILLNREGYNTLQAATGEEALVQVPQRPDLIILQSRSPSCGVKQRYDGTFTGKLVNGAGVAAQLLMENGFLVIDVEDLREDEESVNEQR